MSACACSACACSACAACKSRNVSFCISLLLLLTSFTFGLIYICMGIDIFGELSLYILVLSVLACLIHSDIKKENTKVTPIQ